MEKKSFFDDLNLVYFLYIGLVKLVKKIFRKILLELFFFLRFEKVFDAINDIYHASKIMRYERGSGCKIRFVKQGEGGLQVSGDLSNFFIHETSHLKSDTFIECSGRVKIGAYFHSGRGLTIFSASHDYQGKKSIPYDKDIVKTKVTVKDFVWVGANVIILPGVTVGEGAVIGAGSVVSRDVPDGAVAVGNPAKIIKYRDLEVFNEMKAKGSFF